jgi:EAL domain-containing protein (putative c-di-GMP-specific phosphodiesterase class I)
MASVGIALSNPGSDPEQLLAEADAAMYAAKNAGGNRVGLPHREQLAQAIRTARLLPELYEAHDAGQLVMYGQPIVELRSTNTVAVETLMRWHHPVRGVLPPGDFLDLVEQGPLMFSVGRRALHESCRMAAVWSEHLGHDAPDLHFNVSGRELESGDLSRDVLNALRTYSLSPSRLILELTETHMPVINDTLRSDLNLLRERGVRIAIDDLGTGYSSLTRLIQLPIDILKIDVRFTAGMGRDPACDAIVRAVLGLGAAIGLSVVAEGVETPQQAELLRSYGCTLVQGYLYSRPQPKATLLRYLTNRAEVPQGGKPTAA